MKMSYNIVNSANILSGSEIDFLFHIGQYQDGQAVAGGFDYRSICDKLEIAKSSFYKIIHSLEAKCFIKSMHEYDNWTFYILNNDDVFENQGRYLYLNLELLHSKEFIELKKNEKLICLKIIERSYFGNKFIRITYEKIKEWTGVTLQTAKEYANSLHNIFKDMCSIENDAICITNKLDGNEQKNQDKKELFRKREKSEAVIQKVQSLIYFCKQRKIKYSISELEDTASLFNQYSKRIPDPVERELFIMGKVFECIKQKGQIIAAYINTTISNALMKATNLKSKQESEYVPRGYGDNFIDYNLCWSTRELEARINELLEETESNYINDQRAIEVFEITKDNIVMLLTAKNKLNKIKGARLTHRQVYDKVMAVSWDTTARAPTADRFIEFIDSFVKDVLAKLPQLQIKDDVRAYLRTWWFDFMDKKTSSLYS